MVQLSHSPASATTATWPFSATVSHTVTSANSLPLVTATPVGTLLGARVVVVALRAVLLPTVPITPFWKATMPSVQKPASPTQRPVATGLPLVMLADL